MTQPHFTFLSYPPPCGEGRRAISAFTHVFDTLWRVGVGVVAMSITPTPDPSPQGGGEKEAA
jgi:hypothetical protein